MHYREIETLRDPDGVIAVITEQIPTGSLSFRFLKEFKRNGKLEVTNFLGRRHLPAIARLCVELNERLLIHKDLQILTKARDLCE